MWSESFPQYLVFALCILFPGALPRYIMTEVEYVLGVLTLQFCARFLLLTAMFATVLFISTLPLQKHARKMWQLHCRAMWETDPQTKELRNVFRQSLNEARQREQGLANFKAEVTSQLQRTLAHCVTDRRPMQIPVYILQCCCMADQGVHDCRERRGALGRGVLVHEAHLFSAVLGSLRSIERWLLTQQ